MDKPKLLGVIGGLIAFIIIILVLVLLNSDFDQRLIEQVEAGTPAVKLIPEIEKERSLEEDKAAKHLESHVFNVKYWDGPKSVSNYDFAYYKDIYNSQMYAISQLYDLRIKYVKKEITKFEFQQKIGEIKQIL